MSLASSWTNKIDNVDDIFAEDVNALAEAIIANEANIRRAQTTSEANRTSINRIDDEIENINETLEIQNEKNNEFIKKFSPVIEESANGENIVIEDASEAPLLGLSVMGKTEQVQTSGKNLIPYPYYDGSSKTSNGITFTVNPDGSITFNGTATARADFKLSYDYSYKKQPYLTSGDYALCANNAKCSSTSFSLALSIRYNNQASQINVNDFNTESRKFTIGNAITDAYPVSVQLVVYAGYIANNETIYPMLEKSKTESPYEPFTGYKPSPSPEWAQPLKTAVVADEFIQLEVSDEAKERTQSVILSPFNGLWGVPVSSGGNYTDSDGQQWICNELDLVRGVYIERVVHETIGTLPTVYTAGTTADGKTIYAGYYNTTGIAEGAGLCTVASYVDSSSFGSSGNAEMSVFNAGADLFEVAFSYATTDEYSFRNIFEGQEIILLKKAPTETPFSADVLAQCKALHSYNPTTNIANDKGAHMVVEYVADTKTYIDNKFAELQKAIINNA